MKTFLPLFLALTTLAVSVSAAPERPAEPRVELNPDAGPSRDEIRRTVQHMQALARESAGKLREAEEENGRLVTALNTATQALVKGAKDYDAVSMEFEAMRKWGVDQQARAESAEARAAIQTRLAWKWRGIAFALILAAILYFVGPKLVKSFL